MKKVSRIIKWVVVVLVVLVITAVVVIPKIFPLTKVANYAAGKAGEQIGRTISIKNASFNPFKGVSLEGVVISNDSSFSHRPMIDIKEVVLSYELLPLIFERRVVVHKAGVKGLALLYEKRGKANNFSSLKPKKKEAPIKKDTVEDKVAEAKAKKEKKAKEPIALNIGKLFIAQSTIEYVDYKPEGEKKLNIEDLNIVLSNLSNDLAYSPAKLKGSVKIVGAGNVSKINLDGKITGVKSADVELKIDKLAGDKLLSIFSNIKPKGEKKEKEKKPAQELKIDFSPLNGYNLDFVANLKEFTWARLKVSDIKFKFGLHDMNFTFNNEAVMYGGTLGADVKSVLSKVPAPYTNVAKVTKIDGAKFMDEALDIEGAVEGLLNADVNINGKMNYPTKITGVISATFEKGKIIDAAKLLPGVPKEVLDKVNGKSFDSFFLQIKMNDGKPTVGVIKGKGPEMDIDLDFNLDMDALKEQINEDINKEKERIQGEVDAAKEKINKDINNKLEAEKEKAQEEIDAQKDEAEEALKKEVDNQLKNLIPGQ